MCYSICAVEQATELWIKLSVVGVDPSSVIMDIISLASLYCLKSRIMSETVTRRTMKNADEINWNEARFSFIYGRLSLPVSGVRCDICRLGRASSIAHATRLPVKLLNMFDNDQGFTEEAQSSDWQLNKLVRTRRSWPRTCPDPENSHRPTIRPFYQLEIPWTNDMFWTLYYTYTNSTMRCTSSFICSLIHVRHQTPVNRFC